MKTLHELHQEYLDYARIRNFSRHTHHALRVNVGRFIRWLAQTYQVRSPDKLCVKHLYAWLQHLSDRRTARGLPLRPASVNKNIENVRQFFAHLINQACVQRAFLDVLQFVKKPDLLPTSVLTHAQVKKMIAAIRTDNACGYRDRAMVELLYSTGIRVNELLTLKISDVNFENATTVVTGKGNKQRVVPIGKTALRCLRTYLVAVRPYVCFDRINPFLFLGKGGKPVHYMTFLRMIHSYAKSAGLDVTVTPHTFRRSCTTELIRGGANMYHVKELLGHENLNTLRHYVKLTITDLKKTHEKCHPREKDSEEDRTN